MIKNIKQKNNSEKGAVMMIAVIFFIAISTLVVLGLVGPSAREYKMANDSISAHQSYFLAESGVEDVYYRIKNGSSTSLPETLVLGNSYTITATSGLDLFSTSNVFNQQRKVDLQINSGTKTFKYVTMVGDGGVVLGMNTIVVNGDLYSSGPITGQGGSTITGSVVSSSGSIVGLSGNPSSPIYVGGNVDANTVNYTSATGYIHCLSSVGNNKSCASAPSVSVEPAPISGSLIDQWKNDATSGGVLVGNMTVGTFGTTLGPKKILGNLNVPSGALTVSGTLWVTGNLNVNSGGRIKLATAYGSNSGIIIVDGTVSFSGNGFATGSGTAGSYILIVSTNTSTGDISSTSAISVSNTTGSGSAVLYAPYGTVFLTGSVSPKQITGYKVVLTGNSVVNSGSTFSSSSALNFLRSFTGEPAYFLSGINSWKETQ